MQADRMSDCISMPQLFLLLQSLLLGTTAIFVALMNGYGTDSTGIQRASLDLFVWVLVRLFLKAQLAEQITAEVSCLCCLCRWHLFRRRLFRATHYVRCDSQEALITAELLDGNVKGSVSTKTEVTRKFTCGKSKYIERV